MEHINIISKEAITAPESWPVILTGSIVILGLIGTLIYLFISKNTDRTIILVDTLGGLGVLALIAVGILSSIFFQVPTGRYKYEATIDKENMTVAEYEEFRDAYNHSHHKDGIYYFEDFE